MGLFSKMKEARKQKQEEKIRQANAEEVQRQKILDGDINPISLKTKLSLESDEIPYLEIVAQRIALINSTVQETIGTSKKKGVAGRAIVGGMLLGPLGAVAGAATAGSKQTATTTEKTVTTNSMVGMGSIILTNQRFIFTENSEVIVSVPYAKMHITGFNGKIINVQYTGMLDGEHYKIFGNEAKNVEVYYEGIVKHKAIAPNKVLPKTLSTGVSVADELAKLAKLKQDGILTQAEFDKKKAELLS